MATLWPQIVTELYAWHKVMIAMSEAE